MTLPKIELYTFFYKKAPIVVDGPPYIPIMAGNAASQAAVDMLGDDEGDNISERNKYYSELTGIYWVWKNTSQDIVGSMHYRRFLTDQKEPLAYQVKRFLYYPIGLHRTRHGLIYTKDVKQFKPAILTDYQVLELLKSYDILLPQRRKFRYTVRTHYERYHNKSDLKLMKKIIQDQTPEYLHAFDGFLSGRRMFANNMFVMKRPDFDRCMSWLFSMLFEFEKQIKITDYQGYQERIMGFMAERLFNVWFLHEDLRIKELPVIYFKHLKFSK